MSSTCFEVKEKKTALVKSLEKISLNCFIDLFTTLKAIFAVRIVVDKKYIIF